MRHTDNNLSGVQQSRSGRRFVPAATPARSTRAKQRGREQPPGFIAIAAPRPSRRVAHAPASVSRSLAECWSDLRAVCTCVVTCVHAADHTGIALHFQHTSEKALALLRPSHRERRVVLGLVKALRFAPTRCRGPAGLDDACAQLEGSTYVMAEEARLQFSILT